MQQTLLQFITLVYVKLSAVYKKIFNWNLKLKQQVNELKVLKFGVHLKINACYIFVCMFFQICQNSNFSLSQGSAET